MSSHEMAPGTGGGAGEPSDHPERASGDAESPVDERPRPRERSPDAATRPEQGEEGPPSPAELTDELESDLETLVRASDQRRAAETKRKFRLVYLGLAVVLILGLGAFAGLLVRGGSEDPPPWSAFQPQQPGIAGAQEIAKFVEGTYLLADGSPLVDVNASRLSLQDEPVTLIALNRPDNGDQTPLIIDADQSIEFGLCGDAGAQCAITVGEPSRERLRLLSRESLELALYTFRYLPTADSVVAFLPPAEGEDPTFALFFRRGDLARALQRPLASTLPSAVPATPEDITPTEAETIDALTEPHRFQYALQQLDNGDPVLVLDEPGASR